MDGLLVLNVVPKAKSFFQKLWERVWHSFDQALVLSRLLLLELGVAPLHDFDDEGLRHTSLCSANIPPMATGFNIRPMATVAANIRPNDDCGS